MAQQLLRQNVSKLLSRYPPSSHIAVNSIFHHQTDIPKHQQFVCMSVWEQDRKAGYRKVNSKGKLKHIRDGVNTLGSETALWGEEMKQKFRADPTLISVEHGDLECVWNFHEQEKVDAWKVTADSDNNEGFSKAKFIFSKNRTGVFQGHLSRQVPKDGVTKRSGYCNIRSPTKFRSFKQEDVHDWSSFSHLLLRVRGDGRSYMLTLTMERCYDVFWHDQHHYILFTRGGPYWQTAKIPFSKFYATSKGRIQDKQAPVQLHRVTHLGISIGDDNEGPFCLEIDSIAVAFDENHEEQFAYE